MERSPWIHFASRRIERRDGDRFHIVGDLTIKGIGRELPLQAVLRYDSGEPGELHVGAHGEIMRSDFGLSWREVLEAAGALVSDRVRVSLEIVAVRAGSARPSSGTLDSPGEARRRPIRSRAGGTSAHEAAEGRP